MVQLEAQFLP